MFQPVVLCGMGFMGAMHAQVYRQLDRTEVKAVVDDHPEAAGRRLQEVGQGDVPVFDSLEVALKETDCTVVDICLPTPAHEAACVTALEAGMNVFCEKPLALNSASGGRIRDAAKSAPGILQVGHCIRFWPEYEALERFLAEGSAGKLRSLSLTRRAGRPAYSTSNWLNNEALSGGAALDLHVHDTDYVNHLLGLPKAVTSRATWDYSGPSHIFTLYDYDGIEVCAEGGWNYPSDWGFKMAYQAVFEEGVLEYDVTASPTLWLTRNGGKKEPMPIQKPQVGDSKASTGNISDLGGYFKQLDYFIECVARCVPNEVATVEQALQSVHIVECEVASARRRQTVEVSQLS